jgi:hypothetical protein
LTPIIEATLKQLRRWPLLYYWLPLIAWMGIIFWSSSLVAHRFTSEPQMLAFVLTVLYAVSDEYHQTFVPGRNGTPADALIDAAGAGLGLWLLHRWQKGQTAKEPT